MAYSVDPGMVNTEITRHMGRPLVAITKTIGFLMKTPAEGAYTSIYCTVTPESQLLTGGYYKSVCNENTAAAILKLHQFKSAKPTSLLRGQIRCRVASLHTFKESDVS